MNSSAKVKVFTPHGTGWATEITADDFVWVELDDKAVWIHVADVQIDRQQFSISGSRPLACSLIAAILAFLIAIVSFSVSAQSADTPCRTCKPHKLKKKSKMGPFCQKQHRVELAWGFACRGKSMNAR